MNSKPIVKSLQSEASFYVPNLRMPENKVTLCDGSLMRRSGRLSAKSISSTATILER